MQVIRFWHYSLEKRNYLSQPTDSTQLQILTAELNSKLMNQR